MKNSAVKALLTEQFQLTQDNCLQVECLEYFNGYYTFICSWWVSEKKISTTLIFPRINTEEREFNHD